MLDQDVIQEFLIESTENLVRLDQEMVELEQRPKDTALLASIFRTIHTIKGTCGFLGFEKLEKVTHQAESVLSQLRDGKRELTAPLVSLILESVDAVRRILQSIEADGSEGTAEFADLTRRLEIAASAPSAPVDTVLCEPLEELEAVPETAAAPQPTPAPAPPVPAPVPPVAAHEPPPLPAPPPPVAAAPPAHAPAAPAEPPHDEAEENQGQAREAEKGSVADSTIRVGVGLLDKLMDLVGELVLTRNQIIQFNAQREDGSLNATSQRLNLITTELQEGVMKTRMQPIGMVWNKLPRVVRDMAVQLGKQIRLEMDGTETELDRTIIEAIKDPLVHLVRNSCDHGIERPEVRQRNGKSPQGVLTLRAYHEGGQVNIEISDDGAGMDAERLKQKAIEKGLLRPEQAERLTEREALNLIFEAGFSTAEKITNVSGRGVGMDVVRSSIEKIGGVVDLSSRPNEGTTVKLKIPLTLAIIPGLVIHSGGERFVIPQVSLLELIRLSNDSSERHIEFVHGTPVYRRRGVLLPIAYLNRVLHLPEKADAESVNIVVLQAEDKQFGLVVDGINDTQEIVVKPLGKQLKGLTVYAGATIMGDGRVALILDVPGIGQRSGVLAESRDNSASKDHKEQKAQSAGDLQTLLLFRAGSFSRLAVPLSLVARLEEFPSDAVERAAGRMVVQYRDRILPLVSLREVLDNTGLKPGETDTLQVIVFNDGDRSVGLVVDEIVDVVEDSITVRRPSSRKGLSGSAVVGKKVADFIDLPAVLALANENWFEIKTQSETKRVLIADPSSFARGLVRSSLDMAGYSVLEAASCSEAARLLESESVDVLLADLSLPPAGVRALVDSIRVRGNRQRIPVLAMATTEDQIKRRSTERGGFDDCRLKHDREALLGSIRQLAEALDSAEPGFVGAGDRRNA